MRLLLLLSALLLAAAPVAAQVRIEGIVRADADGAPLAGARIQVLDGFEHRVATVVADSLGTFRIPLRRLGTYRLRTSHAGFRQATGTLLTEAFPFLNVEVRLRPDGALAAPVTVVTRAQVLPTPALEGYHARLRSGSGRYFTRETVDRLRPAYLSDLIATAPGIEVERSADEDRTLHARLPAGRCTVRVYLDGELLNTRDAGGGLGPAPIDGTVVATAVEGIEVYPDPAAVPPPFREPADACGAVAVWTRGAR